MQIVTCNFTVAKTRPLRRSAIALVSLSCLLIAAAIAQGQLRGWEWQNPKPQGNLINAIRFAKDKRHGWAVGADGAILRTENGGFVWKEQPSSANTTLYGLYVKDKSRAVVAGAGGIVFTTVDAGRRWTARPTG